jgi:hypothetical protein
MSPSRTLDRAIEVVVYAPLGAGLRLIESAPSALESFVARGRAEVDHRQEQVARHVTTVRSTGQVALAFGLPKLRNRVRRVLGRSQPPGPARQPEPEPAPAAAPVSEPVAAGAEPARAAWVPVSNGAGPVASPHDAPTSGELPIPGYDSLSASQVVERLTGLVGSELDAVRAYEASHRNRRTILGKIEQLATPGA